jgi:uncharacterized protein (DUF58 family)
VATQGLTFPLVPRRRLVGLAFGATHSARRGIGSDVAGSRPYRPGDDVDAIDWGASAKLSSARGSDEFVVRERYAEEAPRVVVVCDRRPEMELYPAGLPWLRKADAMRVAVEIVSESAVAARGLVGYLDYAMGADEPFWRPPQSNAERWRISDHHVAWPDFRAPADNVARSIEFLMSHRRAVPAGSFLFILSDFLTPTPAEIWARALEVRWDVVPIVIQDPVWERSFPPVGSVVLQLSDAGGRGRAVRLRPGEADERREEHERRHERLIAEFRTLGIEPIVLASSERADVFAAFLAWADEREFRRGRGL